MANNTKSSIVDQAIEMVKNEMANKELSTIEQANADLALVKKNYNKLINVINKEFGKVESSSLKIAFALHQIYVEKMYDIDGFKNIYEFAEERFNLAKSTTNGFINVVEKFAKRDESGNVLIGEDGGIIKSLEKFTFSKLCMLVPVPSEYLEEFYSSMTAKEIRDKKSEIAKLIQSAETPTLSDCEDGQALDGMNPPGEDLNTEDVVTDDSDENTDDGYKRCYINVISCGTFTELVDALNNESIANGWKRNFETILKEVPIGATPVISVGISYEKDSK